MRRFAVCITLLVLLLCLRATAQSSGGSGKHPQDAWAAPSLAPAEGIHAIRGHRNERAYRERVDMQSPTSGDTFIFINRVSRPSLPFGWSTAVVVGTVRRAQTFVTPHKTNIFTEYTLTVEDVLASTNPGLHRGAQVTVEREGGSVKLPSGRIHRQRTVHQGVLRPDSQYVLFLRYQSVGDDYSIVTAYELKGDSVIPVDDEPQFLNYANASREALLADIRKAADSQPLATEVK